MDYLKLSKEVSYALRHAPWKYGLELDSEGWADIGQLISSLHRKQEWLGLNKQDLYEMADKSDKKRFEISGDKIRALYGHSVPQRIKKEPAVPPQILYHGTARQFINSIKEKGLLPQNRQYVHLSVDIETAIQVGKRKDNKPAILIVHALDAWNAGIKFYAGNDKVWLADTIPSKFISFEQNIY